MKTESFIDQYLKEYQSYKKYWNYEDGCVLMGAKMMYEATGDEKYYTFIENYLKPLIEENGTITNYQTEKLSIDSINCSKILFFMYDKTGDEKYLKAIEFTMDFLRKQPRCKCESFIHKDIYPNQIWLDGLYMAQPFYMEYETKYDKKGQYKDIVKQFENVQKYLYDEKKGLCYHAYDETKTQFWADKDTGCSPSFWLRSMGWYMMALVDSLDKMSFEIYEQYRKIQDIFKLVHKGIMQYQDKETKLFRQVIDRDDVEGNYLETSGSAMIAYAIIKACRMGVLSKEKYAASGMEIVDSLLNNKLVEADGKLHLTDICHVAGLGPDEKPQRDGSVEYYLSEKVVSDDPKGVGPFMMAYAEYLQLKRELDA